jgi:hypothetical protein
MGCAAQVRFIAILSEPALQPEAAVQASSAADSITAEAASTGAPASRGDGNGGGPMEEEASLLSDDEHAAMSSTAEMPPDGIAAADGAEQPAEDTAATEATADTGTPTAEAPVPAPTESHDAAQAAEPEAAEADADVAQPAVASGAPADAEAAAQQMPGRRRLTLVLRYVVNPASLLPLYSAIIDMDLHPHLGQPLKVRCAKRVADDKGRQLLLLWPWCLERLGLLCALRGTPPPVSSPHIMHGCAHCYADVIVQVSPAATWASRQQRVRWRLPPLAPGATGDVKAYFEPDTAGDPVADGRRGGLTAIAVEEAVCRCAGCCGLPKARSQGLQVCAGCLAAFVS